MPESFARENDGPLVCVAGTRPEVIKLAPVYLAARAALGPGRAAWIATGQHAEMGDQMLDAFGIEPDVRLKTAAGGDLAALTANLLKDLDASYADLAPSVVAVQGDTTTAMVGALAAFYRRIPVGHVEAGLRSHDLDNPFPEEANRRLIAQIAAAHFAPTALAAANLKAENTPPETIFVTGNTAIDAQHAILRNPTLANAFPPPEAGRRRILATLHRREAWGAALDGVCRALAAVVDARADIEVVLPVHRNPRVSATVRRALGGRDRVLLTEPLGYAEFQSALRQSFLVLTDSGGVQEEAPTFGVPVLVARNVTERSEAIDAGVARLVGLNGGDIERSMLRLLDDPALYAAMSAAENPFGDGKAADRIVAELASRVGATWNRATA